MTDLTVWQTAPLSAVIDHVIDRYHQIHRHQLANIMPLAEKVARVHNDSFPAGILPLLQQMAVELESHMQKEERVLFPLVKQGSGRNAAMPVRVMMMEHDDHQNALSELNALTDNLTAPPHACGSWQRLYQELREFTADLQNHIMLENTIVFPRALNE